MASPKVTGKKSTGSSASGAEGRNEAREVLIQHLTEFDPSYRVGPYAIDFDLISSQYGWDDEQILDLGFARYLQIISSIKIRQYLDTREENARVSWLARNVATFIAASIMSDDNSEAIEAASRLAYDDVERAILSSDESVSDADWQPGDPAVVKREPKAGSFESLVGALGGTR